MSDAPHIVDFGKKIVVITAPSGAGKTTIVKKLLLQHKHFGFSISCTTREKRANEVDGKDYYFISESEFRQKIQNNEFAEYEEVYPGKFYGTLKSEIERLWRDRKVAVFDIDVKGAVNLQKLYDENCLTVFIKPASKEVLLNRLKGRNTESADTLKKRIKRAEEELQFEPKFKKVVPNADFDIAYMNVKNCINAFLKSNTEATHH
ncbi:MAG: guanylate kinase [Chitinophagales bacterium]